MTDVVLLSLLKGNTKVYCFFLVVILGSFKKKNKWDQVFVCVMYNIIRLYKLLGLWKLL